MTVVYAADRKWYKHLPTAIGSLLYHHPDAFVYIICEDDQIDCIKRTKNIKILNINNFPQFIDPTHPNATSHWTIFALMRCFLSKMIDEDKILWLDVDTLVCAPIDELWNMDMTNTAVAGWREQPSNWKHVKKQMHKSQYINSGVLLMNLKFIRQQKFDDIFIKRLNQNVELKMPDQDVINTTCDGYIKYLEPEYNFGSINTLSEKLKVRSNFKIYHMTWNKLWDPKASGPKYLYNSYYREVLY